MIVKFIQILTFYDEPQVLLLSDTINYFIGVAIVKHDMAMPFFVCKVSNQDWEKYKKNRVDLLYLFSNSCDGKYYCFDWINQETFIKLEEIDPINKYFPDSGFMFYDHNHELIQ